MTIIPFMDKDVTDGIIDLFNKYFYIEAFLVQVIVQTDHPNRITGACINVRQRPRDGFYFHDLSANKELRTFLFSSSFTARKRKRSLTNIAGICCIPTNDPDLMKELNDSNYNPRGRQLVWVRLERTQIIEQGYRVLIRIAYRSTEQ